MLASHCVRAHQLRFLDGERSCFLPSLEKKKKNLTQKKWQRHTPPTPPIPTQATTTNTSSSLSFQMVELLTQVLHLLRQALLAAGSVFAAACHLVTFHYRCGAHLEQEEEEESKRRRRRRAGKKLSAVPGPPSVPLLGSLWTSVRWLGGTDAGREYHEVCEERSEKISPTQPTQGGGGGGGGDGVQNEKLSGNTHVAFGLKFWSKKLPFWGA